MKKKSLGLVVVLSYLCLGFESNRILLRSHWRQVEISAHSHRNLIAVGITEKENEIYSSPMRCSYLVSSNGGRDWTPPLIHRNESFDFSANPTVFVSADGAVHAVCMSVKGDYSSGILEYSNSIDGGKTWSDFSEVLKIDQGIPDKPWIALGNSGDIVISYSDLRVQSTIPPNVHSKIRTLVSRDSGKTWSSLRITTRSSSGQPDVAGPYSGYQGSWIERLRDHYWGLSFATYGGGEVVYCREKNISQLCENSNVVARSEVQVPVTQIFQGADGLVGILWYDAHTFSKVYFSLSRDYGVTWTPKIEVAKNGSLATAGFDGADNLINIVLTEKSALSVRTVMRSYTIQPKMVSERVLTLETITKEIPYLGAYQAFVNIGYNRKGIFWISYTGDNQKIMFSELTR